MGLSFKINNSFSAAKPKQKKPTTTKSKKSQTTTEVKSKNKSRRRKMWFVYVCEEEEKELGRQQASGSCPYCGGKVEAMDVEMQWRFCFLPMCFKIKRKYFCTSCARRLELKY
ncbi:uncharacterized protein LOC131599509 [Vicia villosa]|uniref:uncharacterized protein LOC131599509 n=1 Tax=Vicia villosa TaxID=3911 RepID=UPI00273BF58A|nr:uncharacterized protein LOC131599509 [Vicia villosa]